MPGFAAHQKRVEAHVESTGDKKVALVIDNVKVSEIKQIMDFIALMREHPELCTLLYLKNLRESL